MTIYTIGHSNIAIERFVDLLHVYSVQVLVDIRSQPYSRYAPQFNRDSLKTSIERAGIAYVYFGDQLGGRPRDAHYYLPTGTVDYDQLAQAPFYRAGIERLESAAEGHSVAIMCSEAGYQDCHRYKLITRSLVNEGVEVWHILHSGELVHSRADEFRAKPRQLSLLFE